MLTLGVDPGDSGAICALRHTDADPRFRVETIKLVETQKDVVNFLIKTACGHPEPFAYLESVHSFPGQGVSSSFKFGVSFGFLQGILVALNIPFDLVTPQKWQKAMQCARPQGVKESQTEHKNRTKERAQQLFPEITVTHAIADALLIATYGSRLRTGTLR